MLSEILILPTTRSSDSCVQLHFEVGQLLHVDAAAATHDHHQGAETSWKTSWKRDKASGPVAICDCKDFLFRLSFIFCAWEHGKNFVPEETERL